MKHFLLSLCLVAGAFAYTANDGAKTMLSDGTASDTDAAMDYIRGKAEDGWVLTIGSAGGTYTWLSADVSGGEVDFRTDYNLTVQGASSSNRPTITHGPVFIWGYASGKLVTVKDVKFVTGEGRSTYNDVRGSGPSTGLRFTNVDWTGLWNASQTFVIGSAGGNGGTSEEGPYVLFDNCTSEGHLSFNIYCNNGSTDSTAVSPAWRRPMNWGTVKAVVFEACDFRYTAGAVDGRGLTDAFNGGSFVIRHSRIENMMVADHGTDHFANHVKSSLKHEIYDNDFYFSNGSSAWIIYFRGGTGAIYNNRFYATGGATATQAIYWDYYRANAGSGPANGIFDRFYGTMSTTIAAGSNGVDLASKPFTVHVASTAGLSPDSTADIVGPVYTTVASGSNGLVLTGGTTTVTGGTIHVASTADFPSAGTLRIGTPAVPSDIPNAADPGQPYNYAQIAYTGKTSTSFTGCTKNSDHDWTLATGETVAGVGVGEEQTKFSTHIENIKITTSAGVQTVHATGRTATTFTGVRGGTGTMSTGGAVTRASDYLGTQQPGSGTITALIAAGSNGDTLPQSTIYVDSTAAFPASGTLVVNYDWTDGTSDATIAYTGKTATTFTGCTVTTGSGTMATGQVVGGIGQDPRWPNEIWGSMPIWQWNNTLETAGIGAVTGQSVHDFIGSNILGTSRDLYIQDSSPTMPTSTGTWLDNYTPLVYPHPLNTTSSGSSNPRHTPRNARGLGVSRRR